MEELGKNSAVFGNPFPGSPSTRLTLTGGGGTSVRGTSVVTIFASSLGGDSCSIGGSRSIGGRSTFTVLQFGVGGGGTSMGRNPLSMTPPSHRVGITLVNLEFNPTASPQKTAACRDATS